MKFVDDAGRLLLDWPRPQQVGRQGWHASYRFHQPDLRARAGARGLRAGYPSLSASAAEAFALEQERDAVVVRYEVVSGNRQPHPMPGAVRGRPVTVRAHWCGD